MLKKITNLIPKLVRKKLHGLSQTQIVKKILFFGFSRYCTLCNSHLRLFKPFGLSQRSDACCPVCKSMERQRMIWLFSTLKTNLLKSTPPRKLLYIAPARGLLSRFDKIPNLNCITADLNRTDVTEKMDITDIRHPDNSFDIIFCSHVLEHVPDDHKAMREMSRVLKPDGWAIILAPINADKTFEDPSVTDPKERERLFGQNDHVRVYGPDCKTRLEESDFKVQQFNPPDFLEPHQITKNGIKDEPLYFCTKKQT